MTRQLYTSYLAYNSRKLIVIYNRAEMVGDLRQLDLHLTAHITYSILKVERADCKLGMTCGF